MDLVPSQGCVTSVRQVSAPVYLQVAAPSPCSKIWGHRRPMASETPLGSGAVADRNDMEDSAGREV